MRFSFSTATDKTRNLDLTKVGWLRVPVIGYERKSCYKLEVLGTARV